MQTALIIPALNEEPVIGQMLDAIPGLLYKVILVADNGSTDRTAEIAAAHGATVVHEMERGYGAACLRAMEALPPDVQAVVFMQADLSEYPEEAGLLLEPIESGRADMVIGTRTKGTAAAGSLLPHQEFGNWIATSLIRVLYGFRYSDLGPFRAIRREALERLQMQERNYGWTIEMQVRAIEERLQVIEVPVRYRARAAGVNKVSGNAKASFMAGYKIVLTVFRLWLRRRR
jgi:glycosyltransferase involved in cell wall biosynthesis